MRPENAKSVEALIADYLSNPQLGNEISSPRFCMDLVPIHQEFLFSPESPEYVPEADACATLGKLLEKELGFEFGYIGGLVGYEAWKDFIPDESWLREWIPVVDKKCRDADFYISSIFIDSPDFQSGPPVWWDQTHKLARAMEVVTATALDAIVKTIKEEKKN